MLSMGNSVERNKPETVWKLYSGGRLMAFSALPLLTDPNVRCAPVLETTTIRLARANFETVSDA
ncbi:hypothetical protein MES4922_130110 [Mesorhizobium ventifaucium]|uniref:Cyclic nucleotide-binding domain-containing protein n=1 Tax=Mesorhizobium ventifaucium TaxID=666020 RepID=A0ABN8JIE9_9HYPH|nr:hypothetical protein MES4922_130110 [Mesorhizobium ventifaucium]